MDPDIIFLAVEGRSRCRMHRGAPGIVGPLNHITLAGDAFLEWCSDGTLTIKGATGLVAATG